MMSDKIENQYFPDYPLHPGELLYDTLEGRGISQKSFAEKTGISQKHINLITSGKTLISPDTAIKFERVLGIKAYIWNKIDAEYRLYRARQEEVRELKKNIEWSKKFPLAALKKKGCFFDEPKTPVECVNALLVFLGVGSRSGYQNKYEKLEIQFRESPTFTSQSESVIAWLRIGEIQAEKIETAEYNKKKFLKNLQILRGLTCEDPKNFEPKMVQLCSEAGVALVFVPELPKTHISGATFWVNQSKAAIILSLRHKSDDHFWFSFFHEAGHVYLHSKKGYIVDTKDKTKNEIEKEANSFAAATLLPTRVYQQFIYNTPRITEKAILDFSRRINIAPGIVVGRLQNEGRIEYRWHNGLKRKFILIDS
ncbi:MAG: HigA family addiction module antidote protein [Fibrobacteria bacterium]|nr:HigA family addiction module antidote protein [Fibrobacteria bacterium]